MYVSDDKQAENLQAGLVRSLISEVPLTPAMHARKAMVRFWPLTPCLVMLSAGVAVEQLHMLCCH